MNLCNLGIHDYEYIEEPKPVSKLKKDFNLDDNIYEDDLAKKCSIKICLRCGKIVDTLNPMIEELKKEVIIKENNRQLKVRRKQEAIKLYKEYGKNE
ncbi:MAG: hypothetical protein M0Q13_15420 [Methanothrix sp.]|jgi:hypothetical protein|nr:hypothetical protein [Methanothrix sp.]